MKVRIQKSLKTGRWVTWYTQRVGPVMDGGYWDFATFEEAKTRAAWILRAYA